MFPFLIRDCPRHWSNDVPPGTHSSQWKDPQPACCGCCGCGCCLLNLPKAVVILRAVGSNWLDPIQILCGMYISKSIERLGTVPALGGCFHLGIPMSTVGVGVYNVAVRGRCMGVISFQPDTIMPDYSYDTPTFVVLGLVRRCT